MISVIFAAGSHYTHSSTQSVESASKRKDTDFTDNTD